MTERSLPEPFRLFFPLAIGLGLAGVAPWILYALGVWPGYPGPLHMFTLSETFLVAPAVGFLGTMIPRRTGTPPLTRAEAVLLVLALVAVPLLAGFGAVRLSQVAFLVAMLALGRFVVRRIRAPKLPRGLPGSFVFLPVGFALAALGALFMIIGGDAVPQLFWLGRLLAQQALVFSLVLAIAPMLAPTLATGEPPPLLDDAHLRRERIRNVAAAALFAGSFPLELLDVRAGLLLRGAVVLEQLTLGGLLLRVTEPGVHRKLFRASLAFTPLGLLLAGAFPAHRTALLHLSFVGGLCAMIFAVGAHVVMMHTGRRALADGNPPALVAAGSLLVVAALTRASADLAGASFLRAIGLAAGLWLAAAIVWAAFVLPQLRSEASEAT